MEAKFLKTLINSSKELKFLVISSFFIPFASFMIIPFLTIYLYRILNIDLISIGVLTAFASLIQFSGGLPGGIIAYRIGLRNTMLIALSIRSLGFFLVIFSLFFPYLSYPSVILIAIGAALYLPANKAFIVNETTHQERALYLSLSTSVLNAGMAVGPIIGGIFLLKYPFLIFLLVFCLFLVLTILHGLILSKPVVCYPKKIRVGLKKSINRKVIKPLIFTLISFYLYMMFQTYRGLYITNFHSEEVYAYLILLSTLMVVFLQPVFSKFIQKASYDAILSGSFFLFFIGFYFLYSSPTLTYLVFGISFITFAEILIVLKNQLEILSVNTVPEIGFGSYRFVGGIGAFLASLIGAKIFENMEINSTLNKFWLFASLQAFVILFLTIGFFVYKFLFRHLKKRFNSL